MMMMEWASHTNGNHDSRATRLYITTYKTCATDTHWSPVVCPASFTKSNNPTAGNHEIHKSTESWIARNGKTDFTSLSNARFCLFGTHKHQFSFINIINTWRGNSWACLRRHNFCVLCARYLVATKHSARCSHQLQRPTYRRVLLPVQPHFPRTFQMDVE